MATRQNAAGIDGCRAGWIVALDAVASNDTSILLVDSFAAAVERLPDDAIIAIDMPLGIPDAGTRACESLARRKLSPRRSASVFSSPVRSILGVRDHQEACRIREACDGRRISKQAFYIMPKIAEVDAVVRGAPGLEARTFEVHPELSFSALNHGAPLDDAKRTGPGFDARMSLLTPVFGEAALRSALERYPRGQVARDDVLDAFAALWTARRIAARSAERLPALPEYDACGMDMAIWY